MAYILNISKVSQMLGNGMNIFHVLPKIMKLTGEEHATKGAEIQRG